MYSSCVNLHEVWLLLNVSLDLQQHLGLPVVQSRHLVILHHHPTVSLWVAGFVGFYDSMHELGFTRRLEGSILGGVPRQIPFSCNGVLNPESA